MKVGWVAMLKRWSVTFKQRFRELSGLAWQQEQCVQRPCGRSMSTVQGGSEAGGELEKEVGRAFRAERSWRLDHVRSLDLGFSTERPVRRLEQ